jgi:tetratricopeptide (TPR) repeat protein
LLLGAVSSAAAGVKPEEVGATVRQARELFQSGEFNAGILLLEGVRDAAGDQTPILLALGDGYRTMKVWDQAAHFYQMAAAVDSTNASAWSGLGRVMFEAQKPDSARLALARAVRLNPKDSEALGLQGELALERGDLGAARGCFERVLELEGETFDAVTDLAVVYERASDWTKARELLEKAARAYPARPEAHYNLAVLESQAGRFHEAVLEANRALQLTPDNLEVLRFLGVLYFEHQVCEEAIRYFRRVLAVSPTDLDVRIGLASCLHSQGHSDEAVQELESALSETPRDYDLLLLMANIRLEQNRLEEALATARRATAIDSLRPDAEYLLGLTLRRLGREDEAARAFQRLETLRAQADSAQARGAQ